APLHTSRLQEKGTRPVIQEAAGEVADTVESIAKEFEEASAKWSKSYRAASKEERAELMKSYPRPDAYRKRMWQIVDSEPRSVEGGKGLMWIAKNRPKPIELRKALALLGTHHIVLPEIGAVCRSLRYQPVPSAEAFLRAVYEKNSLRDVKGNALYTLAKSLQQRAGFASAWRKAAKPDEYMKNMVRYFGEDLGKALEAADPAKLNASAERYLEEVVRDFADIGGLVKSAKGDLFEIRNLAIGKVAPNIEGEDIDGAEFSTADYRGKVVVLDFWGDW
ncbi:MAG: TlpA family protein disulfide reductase, partial [Planctomycetota bacterium]